MGYSTNIQTLEAMLPDLELLRLGKACLWTAPAGMSAHKWAYKIREALNIAAHHTHEYPELAAAWSKFRIEVVSQTQVQARLAKGTTATSVEILGSASPNNQGLEDAGIAKKMQGQQTATSVIQCWLDTQPNNEKYYFPEARLSRDELLKLHRWSQSQKLLFFVDERGALTLQRRELSLTEYAWSPED